MKCAASLKGNTLYNEDGCRMQKRLLYICIYIICIILQHTRCLPDEHHLYNKKNASTAFGPLPSIRNSLYVVCLVQVSKLFRSSYDQISEINCLSLYHVSKPIGPLKNTRIHKHISTSYQFVLMS